MNIVRFAAISLLVLGSVFCLHGAHAATIVIVNQNAPGVGFNDPTPAAPVGGNPGTTLGAQRLHAFQYAAGIWAAQLVSSVPIRIGAAFLPLGCNATGAVLGAAGANIVLSDFPGAQRPATEVAGLPGTDPAITIPSVRITRPDGAALRTALQRRSRTRSGVTAQLATAPLRLAGADVRGRLLMYTPGAHSPGSSVSHYTTEARPNLLMEPSINDDLGQGVTLPRDLTLPLLRDIGW